MTQHGEFSGWARGLNLTGGLFFLLATAFFLTSPHIHTNLERVIFATQAFLFSISSFLFEFSALWDAPWWLWHVLRMLGFLTALIFFFAELRLQTLALRELSQDLQNAVSEVRDKEALLTAVVDGSPDVVVLKDLQGRYMLVNRKFEELYGVAKSDVVGKTFADLLPEDVKPEIGELERRVVERVGHLERRVVEQRQVATQEYADSHGRHLVITRFPVLDPAGQLVMIGGSEHDVTELKRAEKEVGRLNAELEQRILERTAELADSQNKFRALIDTVPGAVYRSHLDWTMEFYSEAIEELTGYPVSSFIGDADRSIIDLMDPEDARRVVRECEEAVANHQPYALEYRITTASGDAKWMLSQGQGIYSDAGEPQGLQGVVFDITELKRSQAELAEARDAAEAGARAKSEFLAAMSHEIRTPMNGVIGMIDLMMETRMEDDQQQMLTTIKDSAFSLLNIINDILDFSKIEAGKLDLERIGISIRDIIGGVAETLAPNVTGKGLDLVCFVDPRIPGKVLGDQVRVRQILFNLAGNAVKFTEQGLVMIRAERTGPRGGDTAQVRYEVIDQGIGIPAEKIDGLFTPFSQAESSTTRRFGGTGLGLSICASLAELMGGTIEVQSTPGEGSTFSVTIPHRIAATGVDNDMCIDLSGLRLLIISSDAARIDVMRRYLSVWGNRVGVIADPAEAEGCARSAFEEAEPIHIIVQGLDWPDEQRSAMRRKFQSNPVLNRTRFVTLCADRAAARERWSNAAAVEAVPLRREAFVNAVAVAAGRASSDIVPDIPDIDDIEVDESAAAGQVLSAAEAEAQGRLILVAEDNPTNTDVIRRQLKVLGYTADFEPDGIQALEALQRKRYVILLTDCHMPEMDGYELTEAIRAAEKERGARERFPIIAITANALLGEADKCLAVGMDDYLSKPLEMRKLKTMLEKWMPQYVAGDDAAATESPGHATPADRTDPDLVDGAVDLSFLTECFGDDEEIHRDILQEFASSTDEYVDNILEAANRSRAKEIASLAHAFKSAARTVGANELADLCQGLEYAGKGDDWAEIKTLAPRLKPAMEKVSRFIAAF